MSARLLAALFALPRQQKHAALPTASKAARHFLRAPKTAAARGRLLLVGSRHIGERRPPFRTQSPRPWPVNGGYERPFLPAD